ncbi:MAG TPA: hypothetical protein VGV69_11710, partial [Solirubrobacterales bacterium]|nr:hypothetical protein [Solirubrobacterales bacterium]
ITAPVVSATQLTSTKGLYTVQIYSESIEKGLTFTFAGREFICETPLVSDPKEANSTLTMVTGYVELPHCTMSGINVEVTMNECYYLFHLPESGSLATMDLICPLGNEVTFDVRAGTMNICRVHMVPQTGRSHVKFENSGQHVIQEFTVGGIHATLTDEGGFLCPFSGETTITNGTYTGLVTLIGNEEIDVG